jgi:CHAP domain
MKAVLRTAILAALALGLNACTEPRDRQPAMAAPPPPAIAGAQLALLEPAALPKGPLQCVPYARLASGIAIRGDAWTWWRKAPEAAYLRGQQPQLGAVLVFKRTKRLRYGHVAVVSRIVDNREVLVTHSNWSNRGKVVHHVRVIDESAGNDWSEVKVWNDRTGKFGGNYPVYGFIYRPAATQPATIAAPPPGEVPSGESAGEQLLYQP